MFMGIRACPNSGGPGMQYYQEVDLRVPCRLACGREVLSLKNNENLSNQLHY